MSHEFDNAKENFFPFLLRYFVFASFLARNSETKGYLETFQLGQRITNTDKPSEISCIFHFFEVCIVWETKFFLKSNEVQDNHACGPLRNMYVETFNLKEQREFEWNLNFVFGSNDRNEHDVISLPICLLNCWNTDENT